jgi:hypothetical protein
MANPEQQQQQQQQQLHQQLGQMQLMMAMMASNGGMFSSGPPPNHGTPDVTPDEERQLVQALRDAEGLERTYRQVIEDWASVSCTPGSSVMMGGILMHGQKLNQAPEKWQNWYLENGERLEKLIDTAQPTATTASVAPASTATAPTMAAPAPVRKVKKPVFNFQSSSPDLGATAAKKKRSTKRLAMSSDEDVKPTAAELRAASTTSARRGGARPSDGGLARTAASTSNSNPLKRKASTGNISSTTRRPPPQNTRIGFAETTKKLPLLQADVIIPPIRSHSPTPPKEVVPNPSGRPGHIYTRSDRDFFVDFIQYELARDPELGKQELCDMLYAKAPHHSAESWKSHWSSRHAVADNILRLAAERVAARDRAANRSAADALVDDHPSTKKIAPRAALTSRPQPASTAPAKVRVETPSDSEDDGEDVATDWSDQDEEPGHMGGRDAVLTEVDMRAMAKYIARHEISEWKGLKNRTRWLPFAELVSYCERL